MNIFKTQLVDSSTVNDSTSFVNRNVFDTNPVINNSGFSVTSSAIIPPSEGIYECCVTCYFTSTSARTNPAIAFDIGGELQNEVSASTYIRASSGHDEASTTLCSIYLIPGNSDIRLRFAQLGASGTVNLVGTSSSITIYQIA